MSGEPTPWLDWLRVAQRMGVAPSGFWRLSVKEWRALTAPVRSDALSRAAFDELTLRYSDEER